MKPIRTTPRSRSHSLLPLAAASVLLPLLAACGGGSSGVEDPAGAGAGDTASRSAQVIDEAVEQVADAADHGADAVTERAASQAGASADPAQAAEPPIAVEFVTAKSFAQTDLVSSTCLPGVTIAEAVAKLNAARAVGRQCGTTWYPAAPPVVWNEALAQAASAHSQDMATNNYFSHTSLDGRTPGTRITAAGYNWSAYGENIAAGQSTMDVALAGWLASPGHCSNLMNARYKDYGLGCAYKSTSRYRTYWTQDFGAQRSTSPYYR